MSPGLRADVQAARALWQIDPDNVEARSFFRSLLEDPEQESTWLIRMYQAELLARHPDRKE